MSKIRNWFRNLSTDEKILVFFAGLIVWGIIGFIFVWVKATLSPMYAIENDTDHTVVIENHVCGDDCAGYVQVGRISPGQSYTVQGFYAGDYKPFALYATSGRQLGCIDLRSYYKQPLKATSITVSQAVKCPKNLE